MLKRKWLIGYSVNVDSVVTCLDNSGCPLCTEWMVRGGSLCVVLQEAAAA